MNPTSVARRPLTRSLTRAFALAALCFASVAATAQERSIVMASTTSTEQSGLFAHLLPCLLYTSPSPRD